MHTYIICFAASSCDSEWEYLGEEEADSTETALDKAVLRWSEYSRGDLIALLEQPGMSQASPALLL